MEVHRYIENATLSGISYIKEQDRKHRGSKSRVEVLVTGQNFRRITDLKDEGWTHTKKMLGAEPCIEDRPDGMYLRTNKETK